MRQRWLAKTTASLMGLPETGRFLARLVGYCAESLQAREGVLADCVLARVGLRLGPHQRKGGLTLPAAEHVLACMERPWEPR